jgi:trk system potassium uptake protein TrkA
MNPKKVLVIGLGRFGGALAEELWDTNTELIIVDRSSEAIDPHKARASAAFVADATAAGVLENIGASDVDVAVVTPGEDFEATVLCVSQLAQLGVKNIFARAANDRQAHVLRAVGATRAIQVENEMGRRLAVQVLNPVAAHFMDFAMHFRVLPWVVAPSYVGKTLSEVQLRKFDINVLGYFRAAPAIGAKPSMHLPTPTYRIENGDTLLLVSEEENMEKFLASVEG